MEHGLRGWWRLWVVVAALWVCMVLLSGPIQPTYSYVELKEGYLLDGRPTVEFVGDVERAISKAKSTCPGRPIEISGYNLIGARLGSPPSYADLGGVVRKIERAQNLVSCQSNRDVFQARLEFAVRLLSVPLAALIIGFVIQWIYRGFRPKVVPPPAD